MPPATVLISMIDGVRVAVPDSLNLISSYVLREQQDWFEDEIKFLRRLLKPGHKVIDIGANFGVYTLSMARTVGPTGCVWAFEPASSTMELLAEGVAANGFANVVLDRSALSSTRGTARLSLNEQSEANALLWGELASGASELVSLVTLDECRKTYDWNDIAFLKIDAEGEEGKILQGGARFLDEQSPLIQYEVKAGRDLHLELVRNFAALGYASYRLVPGLDVLVPFDEGCAPDGYLLNLFCCKDDRAKELAAQGFLLNTSGGLSALATQGPSSESLAKHRDSYAGALAILPYGERLCDLWKRTMSGAASTDLDEALTRYMVSRDTSLSSIERYAGLQASYQVFARMCEHDSSRMRLASLARVARDFGARTQAVAALQRLSNQIFERRQVDANEPFLAPSERFDAIPPGQAIGDWILAGLLEEFERLVAFSSFYTGTAALPRLEAIQSRGFGSAEMGRRLHLVQSRFGLAKGQ